MLNVHIGGVKFKNPVIASSGTFGFGDEYSRLYDISKLGGICTKGLTLHPREGNSGLRVYETPSGMMNSVGLQNPGIESFIEEELPRMKTYGTNVIANLGGSTLEEYIEGTIKLSKTDIDMIELNISCPNVKSGGMAFGIKSSTAGSIVREVKSVCQKPLIVKLSPNAEDIVDMAYTCANAGADAISLVNTFKAMEIDIWNKRPIFDNIFAGLSGPAIKPIALRMVYEVAKAVSIPVIGMGGIFSAEDALQFIMAGAVAIQVGTANFVRPNICLDILSGIEDFLRREKIEKLSEICGII